MITFSQKGNFSKATKFLERVLEVAKVEDLDKFGKAGVKALASATPELSGKTALSWSYEIIRKNGSIEIVWKNSNVINGTNIAIILQYGHGTRNGGYVQGRDYINEAIKPIFDEIAESVRKEVTRL